MNSHKNILPYFKSLDGLRAFAALGVIMAHYCYTDNPILFQFFQLGNQGVSLFFVLSGFVISRILYNTISNNNYFKQFYIRRILRIFPLYYFSLFIYNLLDYLYSKDSVNIFNYSYHYLYLQNFARTFNWDFRGPGHFWSLAVEEHFYLIWPLVIYLVYKYSKNFIKHIYITLAIIIFLALFTRFLLLLSDLEVNVLTFARIDQLAFGGVLALLEKNKSKYFSPKFAKICIFLGIMWVVICFVSNDFMSNLIKHYAFGILFFGIILYSIFTKSKLIIFILNNRVIQYLGKISYGIYVWHMIFIVLGFHKNEELDILNIAIGISFTLILSALSYHFLELPFLKMKERMNYT